MNSALTPEEYEKMLKAHNWFYEQSSVHEKYIEGSSEHQMLFNLSNTDPRFKTLFNEYNDRAIKFIMA